MLTDFCALPRRQIVARIDSEANQRGARYNGDMELLEGQTVVVAGLGLMGGSLALALRGQDVRLVGVDPDEATRRLALERAVVDEATGDFAEGVRGAALVILAAPVSAILSLLAQLPEARPEGCLVLDLGSTKQAVVDAMDRLPPAFRAAGGHPMCGKEVTGVQAAEAGLFRGQTFILCRSIRTDELAEAVAGQLVTALGARPLWLSAAEHDWLVARVSHLPYFAAAALLAEAASVAQTNEPVWQVSASGFRDTTRLAGSDPQMLRDIGLTNRRAILAGLEAYRRRLDEVTEILERGDGDALYHWLATRQAEYAIYRAAKEMGSPVETTRPVADNAPDGPPASGEE
jgi:prephenate dehydrogenase